MYRQPRETAKIIKETTKKQQKVRQTLSVENYLDMASTEPDEDGYMQNPLELFAPWARFKFTIIDKNVIDDTKYYVYANLPESELARVKMNTQNAEQLRMMKQCGFIKSQDTETSPAYKNIIPFGVFKGKTPAQVLENPQNLMELEKTAKWLEDKLDSYPTNRANYEAIKEAITLSKEGKLKKTAKQVIEIYKVNTRSLASTQGKGPDEKKCLVYSFAIQCYLDNDIPYRLTIRNFWAECNGILVKEGTISDEVTLEMFISEAEWLHILGRMQQGVDILIGAQGIKQYQKMIDYENNEKKRRAEK